MFVRIIISLSLLLFLNLGGDEPESDFFAVTFLTAAAATPPLLLPPPPEVYNIKEAMTDAAPSVFQRS